MSEEKAKEKREKTRISILAVVSLAVSIVSPFLMLPLLSLIHPASQIDIIFRNMAFLPALVALILCIAALLKIKKSHGVLKGHGFAITGILLTAMFLCIWFSEQILHDISGRHLPCGMNLSNLGKAMLIYANENNGKYPTANKWCDLLLKHTDVSAEQFVCPSLVLYWPLVGGEMFVWPISKKGRCHYAMNPNCQPNSPPDMVLLFETKEGWNQFGGPELLTTEKHGGNGCNILFNDTHVVFESSHGLRKLKWNAE